MNYESVKIGNLVNKLSEKVKLSFLEGINLVEIEV